LAAPTYTKNPALALAGAGFLFTSKMKYCFKSASVLSLLLLGSCKEKLEKAPVDFGLVIDNSTNRIDLVEHTFTMKNAVIKQGASHGVRADTTILFHLSPEQMDSLYSQLKAADFFSLPHNIGSGCPGMIPGPGKSAITVWEGKLMKQVVFSACPAGNVDTEVAKVRNFLNTVFMMAYRQEAVDKLPQSSMLAM